MSRMRVTVRADGTELRGYIDAARLLEFSKSMRQFGLVLASVADDDYDPFAVGVDEAWQEGYVTGTADGESGNHVYDPAPNPYREGPSE